MNLRLKLKAAGILALSLLIIYTLKPVAAQAPSQSQDQVSLPTSNPQSQNGTYNNFAPEVPKNISTLSQGVVLGMLSSASCILAGVDPLQKEGKCLVQNPRTGQLVYVATGESGIAKVMGGLIGGTMSIPISSVDYANYAVSNFGVEKSYAQTNATAGIGFNRLGPLVKVWIQFRNIAYLFFVLAFTIIGLAIMLRVKIDARTVMTIQNQIPKIVIALILVTFSYAVGGFLIDIMYVLIYVIILTFSTITPTHINPNANVFSVFNSSFNTNIPHGSDVARLVSPGIGLVYDVFTSGIVGLSITVSTIVGKVFSSMTIDFLDSTISSLFKIPFIPFNAVDIGCEVLNVYRNYGTLPGLVGHIPKVGDFLQDIPKVGGIFGGGADCNFVESFFYTFFAAVFGTLAFLVVIIAILYSLFRIWFTLIKSFIYILLDVMISPLWIMAGIFPGSKLGFGSWVRHLSSHLSVFPMTFAVILLGKTIMDSVGGGGGELFSPPLVGDAVGGNTGLAAIVGFGFILSIPSILEKTKKVVGALDFGLTDIKKSLGVGTGVGSSGYGEYSKMRQEHLRYEPDPTAPGGYSHPSFTTLITRRLPFGGSKPPA